MINVFTSRTEVKAKSVAVLFGGLTLFHIWGIFLLIARINSGSVHEFGVSMGFDEPQYRLISTKISIIYQLFALVYGMRWLIEGLWKVKAWGWWGSIVVTVLIILCRLLFIPSNSMAHEISWFIIGYCVSTLIALILATPIYLPELAQSQSERKHATPRMG